MASEKRTASTRYTQSTKRKSEAKKAPQRSSVTRSKPSTKTSQSSAKKFTITHRNLAGGVLLLALAVVGVFSYASMSDSYAWHGTDRSAQAVATGPIAGLSGKCLDNKSARVANRNKIQLYQCNGTVAQKWTIYSDNSLRVQGYCLDVAGASKEPRTRVQLYRCNGTAAQKWTFDSNGAIVNPNSGLCLDVRYANTANGAVIWTYTCNGTKAQKWEVPSAENSDTTPSAPSPDQPTPAPTTPTTPAFSTAPGRPIPDTLYGVTTEIVSNLPALETSLGRHAKRPTTRVVFQQGTSPSYYSEPVERLRSKSYIMGQILDSTALEATSASNYASRTRNFVNQFKDKIDIYEIGNELNGEWVGSPSSTYAKVQAAYNVVEKENAHLKLRSAVTLNYWPSSDCYAHSWENTTSYARGMPADVRNGVDYLFLSFYETACSPRAYPTNEQFISIFNTMKSLFPNAKIGMGEVGSQGTVDGLPSDPTLAEQQRIANRYYGMHDALKAKLGDRYVGGYFWWYYYQHAVPHNKPNSLWPTLEANLNSY